MRLLRQSIAMSLATALLLVLFQNCEGSFQATSKSELSSLSGESDSTLLKSTPCLLPSGLVVDPGVTVSGFATNSTVFPQTCGVATSATCLASGVLDNPSALHPSCIQYCLHPDTGASVVSGTEYVYYSLATGASQIACESAKVTSTCSQETGQFSPAIPAARHSACLVEGDVCAYPSGAGFVLPTGLMSGDTVMGYAAASATYPALCGPVVTRTCQSGGNWTGKVPLFAACVQNCIDPSSGFPAEAGSTYVYYSISTGTSEECSAAKITSTCQASSGEYVPPVSSTKYTSCTIKTIDPAPTPSAANSKLWGVAGELWSPTSRLPDFSFAGYGYGDRSIPDPAVVDNVLNHGAIADDGLDDTQAFKDAIAAVNNGAIFIPAGTYQITEKLVINKSNLVLRGAGQALTKIYFPKSMGEIYGITYDVNGTSNWSFGPSFIQFKGVNGAGTKITDITAQALRGASTLSVASTAGITVGSYVRIYALDPATGSAAGSLMKHLHADLHSGGTDNLGKVPIRFVSKVISKTDTSITLQRNLPMDIRTAWAPSVNTFEPTVTEVGIEDLTLEFKHSTYPGHFKEKGYNAIDMVNVVHSWVRNIKIINADYGVNVGAADFITLKDITFDTSASRGTFVGHHAINLSKTTDSLVTGFKINKVFIHDLGLDWYSRGNVYSNGQGANISMDHHHSSLYSNLFTNLHMGVGSRSWESGGGTPRGPPAAAYNTYWNLRASSNIPVPASDFGPRLNFIGVQFSGTPTSASMQWFYEAILSTDLAPKNIHEAMLAKRK